MNRIDASFLSPIDPSTFYTRIQLHTTCTNRMVCLEWLRLVIWSLKSAHQISRCHDARPLHRFLVTSHAWIDLLSLRETPHPYSKRAEQKAQSESLAEGLEGLTYLNVVRLRFATSLDSCMYGRLCWSFSAWWHPYMWDKVKWWILGAGEDVFCCWKVPKSRQFRISSSSAFGIPRRLRKRGPTHATIHQLIVHDVQVL